jgi:hypothetical protein
MTTPPNIGLQRTSISQSGPFVTGAKTATTVRTPSSRWVERGPGRGAREQHAPFDDDGIREACALPFRDHFHSSSTNRRSREGFHGKSSATTVIGPRDHETGQLDNSPYAATS